MLMFQALAFHQSLQQIASSHYPFFLILPSQQDIIDESCLTLGLVLFFCFFETQEKDTTNLKIFGSLA